MHPTVHLPGLRALAGLLLAAAASLVAGPSRAQVGLTQLQAGSLPVTLVYPTAAVAQPRAYGRFTLQVAADAAPLPGPHRLVVLSHGTGGSWVSDHALATTLARAGFVVAQPLHRGDNFRDASRAGPDAWATRPDEVRQVIDLLAGHPAWQARLRLDKVGVHGMSAGGSTALALAGGQWRMLDLVQHCLAQGEADLGFCYNGLPDAAAQAPRRAQFEAARGVPAMFLPAELKLLQGGRSPQSADDDPRPDARVASVSVSVPVAAIFTRESLARIRVPVGVVSAGRDTMLPPVFHSARLLRDCPACRPLAMLDGAAHMDLLAPFPSDIARDEAARQPRGGLPAPGFDAAQRDAAFQAIADFHRRNLGP
jgi:predicted dienelactone hydrolase